MHRDRLNALELRKEQIWWILLPLVMAVAVAVLVPVIEKYQEEALQQRCQRNMRDIALWTLTYAADNDGVLPTGPDWVGEIGDYVRDRDALVCPAAEDESSSVSYVLNPDLRGVNLNLIENPRETVLIYEGEVGEVIERHREGANYAFADGSVDWREAPPDSLNIANVEGI